MADVQVPISLRGLGSWQGRNVRVVSGKNQFLIKDILNGYVNSDGTEIRSFPGWKAVTNVDYRAYFDDSRRMTFNPTVEEVIEARCNLKQVFSFFDCGGRTCIIGESKFRRYKPVPNVTNINAMSQINVRFTVADSTGFLFGETFTCDDFIAGPVGVSCNKKFFIITSVMPTLITATVVVGVVILGNEAQAQGTIERVRYIATPASIFGHHQDRDSLTAYWIEHPIDVDNVASICFPSQVANRQMDFGDTIGLFAEGWANSSGPGLKGVSRRHQKTPTYKPGGIVSGDKIILPIPGYGCIFQVPFNVSNTFENQGKGVHSHYNGYHDRPRSLGVPKAALVEDLTIVSGAGTTLPSGNYKVAISYADQYTGEVGLASESKELTITGAGEGITVAFIHPGYLFSETLALSVIVWATSPDGVSLGFLLTVPVPEYGLPAALSPNDLQAHLNVVVSVTLPTVNWTTDINSLRPPETIAQMAQGGKTVSVIRGHTFIGGHMGTHGFRKSLQSGSIAAGYSGPASEFSKLNELQVSMFGVKADRIQNQFNVALSGIPPAYAGTKIFGDETPFGKYNATGGLFLLPVKIATLDEMVNCDGTTVTGTIRWMQRWRTKENVNKQGSNQGTSAKEAFILLQEGFISSSEKGFSHAFPAPGRIILDNAEDQDCEVLGRYGNILIACTVNQTFGFVWGESPIGSSPSLLSSEIGSIAYNSFVEFEGGCAWLGERGIALMGPDMVPTWLAELERDFVGSTARFKRDSLGKMAHSWSAHDRERSLIYFGLRADHHNTLYDQVIEELDPFGTNVVVSLDGVRSKVPCDEIIVYSYRKGAVSRWIPPSGLAVHWMQRKQCADGVYRMCFLAEDSRIYALDDAFADTNRNVVRLVVNGAQSGTVVNFTTTFLSTPNVGTTNYNSDNIVRAGMEAVQFRTKNGVTTAIARSTVDSVAPPNITFVDSFTVLADDEFLVGIIPMTIETHAENFGTMDKPKRILNLSVRHSMFSTTAEGVDGQPCWVEATGKNERKENYKISDSPREMNKEALRSHETLLDNAILSGHELRLKIEAYGGQQIRISDIEIAQGEMRS